MCVAVCRCSVCCSASEGAGREFARGEFVGGEREQKMTHWGWLCIVYIEFVSDIVYTHHRCRDVVHVTM